MIQQLLYFVCLAFLLSNCGTSENIPPPPPLIQCGILTFESRAGMKASEAESVTEMFASVLQRSGRFTVVERKQLSAVLQEQGFLAAQSGEDISKAGKILAIHKMFSGSIGKLGEAYVVILKMVDVESSQVDLSISRTYNDDLEEIGKKFLPNLMKEVLLAIDGPPKQ